MSLRGLENPRPPSEASWAPLTPWERGTDFQGLVGLESTASQHLEGIILPKGETQGDGDGGVSVCVYVLTKLCVFYREWLNCIVLWELGNGTVTSWEILGVEWGWHQEVKTEMTADSEIQCTLFFLCVCWRGGVWVLMHAACMALCSCNLFEDWVFHSAAGCRALDPWQQCSSIWAWPKTRWLCMCDPHPAPPFLPLTPTYRATASGTAHQVLPVVGFTAAQVLLLIESRSYLI